MLCELEEKEARVFRDHVARVFMDGDFSIGMLVLSTSVLHTGDKVDLRHQRKFCFGTLNWNQCELKGKRASSFIG
jgi:hypothetical protein